MVTADPSHYVHRPVLMDEAISQLVIRKDGFYVDATFGRGGHSTAILKHLSSAGKLLAIDQDWEAVAYAKATFHDRRFTMMHGNFANLSLLIAKQDWTQQVDGILFDLGVSSPQLDDAKRGFSFMRDGLLDMRMNTQEGISALTWLATVSEKALTKVLWEGGEERFARRVAQAIVHARQTQAITHTRQLADIVAAAIPKRQPGKHPATQTFQAIRIAINREFTVLPPALKAAVDALIFGGRLAVITFHSTEDQLVKQVFREQAGQEVFPRDLPIRQADIKASLKVIGRRIKPSAAEIASNPRARSATLRIAEKLI